MYTKSGASAQNENNQKRSQTSEKIIQKTVHVGDHRNCPECRSIGSVVWVSQDLKTMGVQCHKSHREASRPASRYGGTVVRSTKTRKNIVFLTETA